MLAQPLVGDGGVAADQQRSMMMQPLVADGSAGVDRPPLHSPWSMAWAAPPLLGGGILVCVAFHNQGETMCRLFPFELCGHDHLKVMHALVGAFGVLLMSQLILPYNLSRILKSRAFAEMRERLTSEGEAQLSKGMGGIVYCSSLCALVSAVIFAGITSAAFETADGSLVIGLVAGSYAMGHWRQICFVYYLCMMCHEDIDAFIKLIKPPASREGNDWAKLAKEHHALDGRLENLWSEGAYLLCPSVAQDLLGGGICVVSGAVIPVPMIKTGLFVIGASLFASVWILALPARITHRCNSVRTRDSEVAIRAAVLAVTCHADVEEPEEISQLRFLQYASSTTIGVELFGVLLTNNVLLSIFVHMATVIPMAVGILEGLLRRS